MPIGTPRSLGTANSSGSAATLTTTNAINAGDTVFVTVFNIKPSAVVSVTSISDGTNSYIHVADCDDAGASGNRLELWRKDNASAVSSSATITVNNNAAATNCFIAAMAVAGLVSPSLDANPNGVFNANTNTPSVPSGALAQDIELLVGVAGSFRGNNTETASGFTNLSSVTATSVSTMFLDYKIVTAASSVSYAPTWTGVSGEVFTIVASFKGVPLNGWLTLPEQWKPKTPAYPNDLVPAWNAQVITQTFVSFQNGWMYIPDEYPPRKPWYKEQSPAWDAQPITQTGVPTQNGWMYIADQIPFRKPWYKEQPFTAVLLKSTLPVPISGTPFAPPSDDQPKRVPTFLTAAPASSWGVAPFFPNPVAPAAPKFIRNADPVLEQIRQAQPTLER